MAPRVTPRQFDLLLTRSQKFAVVAPLAIFTLMPVFFFVVFHVSGASKAMNPPPPFFPVFPLIFFLGFAAFYGWSIASLPYRITATLDQQLLFKSLLSVRSARVSELLSIEPRGLRIQAGVSGYILRHRGGEIRFPGQFSGLYVLLTELKNANPSLEIRGC